MKPYRAPLIREGARLWRDCLIYWDGRGYRWSRSLNHRDLLPSGAKPGRIATPFNAWLKGIKPDALHRIAGEL